MNLPSKLLEEAVNEISKLPGIGKKSALRIALSLLKKPQDQSERLADSIKSLRLNIQNCKRCNNLSDSELCAICTNLNRDESIICVVQDVRDVLAIENTAQYNGLYHVLGGVISPMDGVGPDDIATGSLAVRVKREPVKEIIMALSPTMEGDTTAFYISKILKESGVKISTISRGVAVGNDLEYTDEVTLGRSIQARTLME